MITFHDLTAMLIVDYVGSRRRRLRLLKHWWPVKTNQIVKQLLSLQNKDNYKSVLW